MLLHILFYFHDNISEVGRLLSKIIIQKKPEKKLLELNVHFARLRHQKALWKNCSQGMQVCAELLCPVLGHLMGFASSFISPEGLFCNS